jgi:leucyl/phenylalanyl-tRNA--protein transferase
MEELLHPQMLLSAYAQGLFPMGQEDGSIRWYRPQQRGVLPIVDFHLPRRFERWLKGHPFEVRFNTAFGEVMRGCADREETWITPAILEAYEALHRLGQAHSAEVWRGGSLVGGVYGVSLGAAFFGESMFSRETQASKVALVHLQRRLRDRGFLLHDTQWTTPHLAMFGGHEVPAAVYQRRLAEALRQTAIFDEDRPPSFGLVEQDEGDCRGAESVGRD